MRCRRAGSPARRTRSSATACSVNGTERFDRSGANDPQSAQLPAERRLGEVRDGFRADLLLLDRPPELAIEDFPASPDLVITRGAVYPRTVRDAWLERIRAEYHITCPPYCRP